LFSAKVMAGTALDLLADEKLVLKAKEEFKVRMGDKKYKSPLTPDDKPPLDVWKK